MMYYFVKMSRFIYVLNMNMLYQSRYNVVKQSHCTFPLKINVCLNGNSVMT